MFDQPEAELFGRTLCWLVEYEWRVSRYGWQTEPMDDAGLLQQFAALFGLAPEAVGQLEARLRRWKADVDDERRPANLVRNYYEVLSLLDVEHWDLDDPIVVNRMGTLARCSQLLADYEAANRRSRPSPEAPGEQRGARDRGRKYYEWLARYVQNWARGAYESFEGEEDVDLDAVALLTVHKAKGLEWPLVFVPALTDGRFPSRRIGKPREWLIPRKLFDASRYEGTDDDERRLFYVALTRARDFLSLSTFQRIRNSYSPSPYLLEVTAGQALGYAPGEPPVPEPRREEDVETLETSFSELAAFSECGLSYRLRGTIGFQPPLVPEIGYGRAVHHILRLLAEHVRTSGAVPDAASLDELFDRSFYLPAANRPAHRQLKAQARRLIDRYISDWGDDLHRVWAVERPFSLHFGDATIEGRADVILDEAGDEERLSIVDYKTAADAHERHAFQLRVYTEAGRREGLAVERAFVHDLRGASRHEVGVGAPAISEARAEARMLLDQLRAREFVARPGPPCARCDVGLLCRYREDQHEPIAQPRRLPPGDHQTNPGGADRLRDARLRAHPERGRHQTRAAVALRYPRRGAVGGG